jgi:hypothetical protein
MMSYLIKLQLNFSCMYCTGESSGSASGLSWKSMIKTRSQSTLDAVSLKRWLCRFMLTTDEDLAIGYVLNISSSKLVVT